MIYIYTPRRSDGARYLVTALRELNVPVQRLTTPAPITKEDLIVNWGSRRGRWPDVLVLNARIPANKYQELQILSKAGLDCVEFGVTPQPGWLARTFHHREASDLRANLTHGDYYVRFRETQAEFRVHIWRDLSIRFGVKIPRIPHPHPKWRSWESGWRLAYTLDAGGEDRAAIRNLARRTIQALGLDFGAVDIGRDTSGRLFVFEVNTAPGLEGGTIVAYATKIAELTP